jgi:hypothetical protein
MKPEILFFLGGPNPPPIDLNATKISAGIPIQVSREEIGTNEIRQEYGGRACSRSC